jgi:hypothetical protein
MAIAFDAATDGGVVNPGTSLTYAHTCTGSNRILLVFAFGATSGDTITGATYGGVAMTAVSAAFQLTGDRMVHCWYLVNPASGANNVVVSASGSQVIGSFSMSYTGAKQSGQPDASNTGENPGQTSFSLSVTTIADNCWTVLLTRTDGTNNTAGANTTERLDSVNGFAGFDRNADITPPGSSTLATSASNASPYGGWIVSIAPAVAVSAVTRRQRTLVGVGQ